MDNGLLTQVLAFFHNESYATVAALVVGMIFKFVPAFRNYSNEIIPLLTAVTAWCVHVFAPPAEAGIFGTIGKALGSASPFVLSVIDTKLAQFLHEHIFRQAATALNIKKPEPTSVTK